MSAIKTIRTHNIQSHKDVLIELPETGVVVFQGPNSNGKSVITKVIQDTVYNNISKLGTRKSLVNRDVAEGFLEIIRYDGSSLYVNINLEASKTYVKLTRANGEEVTRYLADKTIPDLVEEFGFHYNSDRGIDLEVSDVILDMDKRLPSDNEYINEMVGSAAEVLTPTNSMELARTMMRALQEKREAFVLMEEQVRKVIDSIRELFDRDEAIIQYQQHITQMLKAHRVEDAVIIDSVIKNILNVYIGQRGSGLTATALTWSGCLARRRNTLLIN